MATSLTTAVVGGWNVTHQPIYRRHGRMVHDYYERKIRAAAERGRERKRGLTTPGAIRAYQQHLWRQFEGGAVFGPYPEATPLNARSVGAPEQRTGYRFEKVLFESRPGLLVSATLYLPDAASPTNQVPIHVGLCGHWPLGKASQSYQSFGQSLAKLGHGCLVIDGIGQGERRQFAGPTSSTVSEHLALGRQCGLTGRSLGDVQVWDAMRAVDYIETRPELSPGMIGAIGNSGGGTQCTLLCAADRRIAMAASSCFNTEQLRNYQNELFQDAEQVPDNLIALGFDIDDLFIAHAPKPLILIGQILDYFDVRGLRALHDRLVPIYETLGVPENLRLHVGPGDHGFKLDGREAAYSLFDLATGGSGGPVTEPPLTLEPEDTTKADTDPMRVPTLLCTPTANVATEPGGVYLRDLLRDEADALAVSRGTPRGQELRDRIVRRLGIPTEGRETPPDYSVSEFYASLTQLVQNDPTKYGYGTPYYVKRLGAVYHVESEPGIRVPLYRHHYPHSIHSPFIPKPDGQRAIVYIAHKSSEQEQLTDYREPAIVQAVTAEPNADFFQIDVRGKGESAYHFNSSPAADFYDITALACGDQMGGKRVWDVLRCLDLLASVGYTDIYLIGLQSGAIIAALVAALDSRVTKVVLKNCLTRWRACAAAAPDQMAWEMGDQPQGVLLDFDLSDLRAELEDRLGPNFVDQAPFGAWLANPAGEM